MYKKDRLIFSGQSYYESLQEKKRRKKCAIEVANAIADAGAKGERYTNGTVAAIYAGGNAAYLARSKPDIYSAVIEAGGTEAQGLAAAAAGSSNDVVMMESVAGSYGWWWESSEAQSYQWAPHLWFYSRQYRIQEAESKASQVASPQSRLWWPFSLFQSS